MQVRRYSIFGGVLLRLEKRTRTPDEQTPIRKLTKIVVLSDTRNVDQRCDRCCHRHLSPHGPHDTAHIWVQITAIPVGGNIDLATTDIRSTSADKQIVPFRFNIIDFIVLIKCGTGGGSNGFRQSCRLYHEVVFDLHHRKVAR